MASRKAFSEYTPAADASSCYDTVVDEITRELTVRKRVYDRWLEKADMTWSEGDSRMRAMMGALKFLHGIPPELVEQISQAIDSARGPKPF